MKFVNITKDFFLKRGESPQRDLKLILFRKIAFKQQQISLRPKVVKEITTPTTNRIDDYRKEIYK